jgi:hypothetical protein
MNNRLKAWIGFNDGKCDDDTQLLIDDIKGLESDFKEARQLLSSWQTQDPKHHYDEFDPDSLGCITRAFLEKLK